MSTGSTGSIFPKWQLAVLLGAPIALGLSYWYYRNQSPSLNADDPDDVDDTKTGGTGNKKKRKIIDLKNQTISLDGDETSLTNGAINKQSTPEQQQQPPKPVKVLTPLEQATQYKNEGNDLFKKGKYMEATQLYDKAIEKCPQEHSTDLATFYQNRAAAYELMKQWENVIKDCDTALGLNPRYIKALLRRARANELIANLPESLEDITAACILEGFQNNSTLTFADRILKRIGQFDVDEYNKTRTYTIPSEYFITNYFKAFKCDPFENFVIPNLDAGEPKGFLRAKRDFDRKYYDEIISSCTEEIESSESESQYKTEAHLLRGTFYSLTGQIQNAMNDFELVINDEASSARIRSNAMLKNAALIFQQAEDENRFVMFDVAEKLDPENSDIFQQRGQIFIVINELNKAISEFERCLQLTPDSGIAHIQKCFAKYRLAINMQNQEDLFKQLNEFKLTIEKYPNCVDGYSVLAQVLTEQGQYEQSDLFYEKAVKIAPDDASLYVHRGINQLQWNGDVEQALKFMNNGAKVDPKCELAYETMGTIEVQRGHLEKAVKLFDKAIAYAKSDRELSHLFALKNAANAQISVAKRLGIDMGKLSEIAMSGQLN